jgi:hypothetical protein
MDFSLNKQTILYILLYIIVFFIIYFLLYIYTYKLLHYFFPDKIEGFKAQAEQTQQAQAQQTQQAQARQTQAQQAQKNIILLGDSILNNSMYVKKDESIQNLLVNKAGKNKIYYMAKDGAVITDIYEQFSTIPLEIDSDQTLFFISVGGNDILNKIKKDNIAKNMTNNLNKIFSAYKKLIKAIQTRFIKSKIVLLDIYLPPSLTKLQNDYIKQWNKLLSDYSDNNNNNNNNNNIKNLITISLKLTNKDDFVNGYEPSPTGGKKIVDQIFYNI